jgi:HEAT repeat protein
VRAAALSGLADAGTPEAVDTLAAAAARGDEELRVRALALLAHVDDARATPVIAAAIADPSPQIAASAIYTASSVLGPEIDDAIAARLADPAAPQEVRMAAAHALRSHGGDLASRHEAEIVELIGEEDVGD